MTLLLRLPSSQSCDSDCVFSAIGWHDGRFSNSIIVQSPLERLGHDVTQLMLSLRYRLIAACLAGTLSFSVPAAAQQVQRWSGTYAEEQEAVTMVVDSPKMWTALWSATRKDAPVEFDAAHQVGIGIFLGKRPTGGYGVRIPFMGPRGGHFVIEVDEAAPEPGAIVTQAVSSPWLVLLIVRPDLPVSVEPRFHALSLPRKSTP